MGVIPSAKEIAQLVQTSMQPTINEMSKFTELLTRQVELSALMVELQHAQLRGRVFDSTFDARVHAALADTRLTLEVRSNALA